VVPGASSRFEIATNGGEFDCESVIVATGGLSIPKMGATGFGYDVARQFGHGIVEPRPGLVPVVFGEAERALWCDLSGVSAEVIAQAGRGAREKNRRELVPAFREKMLITHRGLSGPAVLQASSYWSAGEAMRLDLAPGREVLAALFERNAKRDRAALTAALRGVLPARFAERWVEVTAPKDWTNAGLGKLEAALHDWSITPEGTEGYAKAEVTAGGVDTRELDARTMQSRRVEGVYFIGEVVDVTGWLGGYNFQWAWASGASAGRAA
jgi:predicted Rossmann fold flavoprotein